MFLDGNMCAEHESDNHTSQIHQNGPFSQCIACSVIQDEYGFLPEDLSAFLVSLSTCAFDSVVEDVVGPALRPGGEDEGGSCGALEELFDEGNFGSGKEDVYVDLLTDFKRKDVEEGG